MNNLGAKLILFFDKQRIISKKRIKIQRRIDIYKNNVKGFFVEILVCFRTIPYLCIIEPKTQNMGIQEMLILCIIVLGMIVVAAIIITLIVILVRKGNDGKPTMAAGHHKIDYIKN